jgi:hypothetical protein
MWDGTALFFVSFPALIDDDFGCDFEAFLRIGLRFCSATRSAETFGFAKWVIEWASVVDGNAAISLFKR